MKIGFLGGGQLARMMAQAGKPMGHDFIFLDPSPDACAFEYGEKILTAYDDVAGLEDLAKKSDVVTFEFENVPAKSVKILSQYVQINPPAFALDTAQDRLKEKNTFNELEIPTTKFHQVDSLSDLHDAALKLGLPLVLKTRSQGYDGKGQFVLRTTEEAPLAWETLKHSPLIAEEFIHFDREISIIAVRNFSGEICFYSICENQHAHGILRMTQNRPNDPFAKNAQTYITKLLNHFSYVGVLTLEMFQKGNQLLANEIAPRVHNSGHWTIEGAETSQFENHLRAILNIPLGSTKDKGFSAMINYIGELPNPEKLPHSPNIFFHDYKKSPRPNRKIGHLTITTSTQTELNDLLIKI